jgi:hypothetical protein
VGVSADFVMDNLSQAVDLILGELAHVDTDGVLRH